MKLNINILSFTFLLTASISAFGQDPQLSQYYSAPLYLAPSFAGATTNNRIALNCRNQWPSIPGAFNTCMLSYDRYFRKIKSGVGVLFLRDVAGSANLGSTSIGIQYSYDIKVNKFWHACPGIHFYYTQRSIDFHKLILGDQLKTNSNTSVQIPPFERNSYFDASTSLLIYSRVHWYGFTVDHLQRPNQAFFDNYSSRIPIKLSVWGGTKFDIKGLFNQGKVKESISPSFIYKTQGKYDQLDLGCYWNKEPIVFGIWYRGIPLLKAYKKGYMNDDAIVLITGYRIDRLSIGYSYDFTISKLSTSAGGAHEISIIFLFPEDETKQRIQIVPCPKF